MNENETIRLSRDCVAVLIPAGDRVTLPEGSEVIVTQSLGGAYTVLCNGMMARIDGADADALGKMVESKPPKAADGAEGPVNEQAVWDQMKTCYDPEIPVNIVDLGLIYDCQIFPAENGASRVEVKMTLTAPGCGMGAAIAGDVDQKIRGLPGVSDVNVELVWDPPWNQGMMTEAARLQLGLM